ncbi:MAG: hypothetical protein APF76_16710 [Desulfitibacter sp. BRH_c19]|nr:MAG: hypothetical protein APF76_16710 [Desulfitibacter sp. BRH_c19]
MEITDENVIQQLKYKNQDALEYIMDTYSAGVYGLACNILKDLGQQEDIEECVSDVFVSVWEDCHHYNPIKGSIKTWLLILTKYKALDYRRQMYGEKRITRADNVEKLVSPKMVENEIILKEEISQITAIIDQLGDKDQQIFYKRYFLYETIDKIAGQLGLTRHAVDNRLWRIRKILKENVAE